MNYFGTLGWMGVLAVVACDLEPKNLGNETAEGGSVAEGGSEGSTAGESAGEEGSASMEGGSETGGACADGDTKMEDCNTCSCLDGFWGCTEIDCGGAESPPPAECEDGDTKMEDCNTCSCLDGYWACTEIGCPPDGGIDVCDDDAPHDALTVGAAAIAGDVLTVDVSYGGGCEMHLLDGCWDGSFAESDPVQVWAFVSHESNDDPCDAIESRTVEIDLSPMKADYQAGYQTENGTIEIHLEGWADALLYSF